jgi:hypothetical protein
MPDDPKPEADALEQERALVDGEDDLSSVGGDPEVPEADRLDQRRSVAPASDNAVRTRPEDLEVPDADAAEQRRAVVDDDEEPPD